MCICLFDALIFLSLTFPLHKHIQLWMGHGRRGQRGHPGLLHCPNAALHR